MVVQDATGMQRAEGGVGEIESSTYIFIACPQEFFLWIKSKSGHWGWRCIWRRAGQRDPRCLQQHGCKVSTRDMGLRKAGAGAARPDGEDEQVSGGCSYLIPVRLHISRLWGGGESMHGSRQTHAARRSSPPGAAAERHEETGMWYAV